MVFRLANRDRLRMLTVRTSLENLKSVNEYLEEQWKQMIPNYPYNGFFQEEEMAQAKSINKSARNVFFFLALIATLLSTIGLYSLVSLMVIRRTKEIGIRKVMGAAITRIILILVKIFIVIIIVASFLGIISGYYLSRMLMGSIWNNYADANIFTFLLPARSCRLW